ncbi:major capsid protein [Enterococcus caccae]|uniref:HK97 family phage major capsid protein n=1 Tax=Enterococcus caccae ATCC BAA-1240 TaxID=1158612 RepID=R3TW24_9ENTE|nr:major capsid protein [Enterococcus caccae]EOL45814.1 hypothetical protein UC7_01611 [Enterococcus caccae ATCC BAA-1240]EOT61010.1 hypothetical protein I580_01912 [Enterococcus caccae ATCC BAA-1240]
MKNLLNLHQNKLKMNLQMFTDEVPLFELVAAPEMATYWTEKTLEQAPYLGEVLFPNNKQLGMELAWFIGQTGAPKALQPSALDAAAIPRDRADFEKLVTDMFFFKESKYIDEKLRQELLKVMQSGNQGYIDAVMNKIFADVVELINGASVTREIMRMQLLTTGKINVSGNGQDYSLDYGMKESHKGHVKVSWTDSDNSDPVDDIETAMDTIEADTGERPTRAIFNSVVLRQLRNSKKIGLNLYPNGAGNIRVSKADVIKYLQDELELEAVVYSKLYTDENGNSKKFVSDNILALLPAGELGSTWFGTTPEEADLMASNIANVSIVDTGVAVTTTNKVDPVNVDTKVSMMSLPSFEQIEKVFILNTIAKA